MWLGFFALVAGALALDLGVFHRRPRETGVGEALAWTGMWVGLALAFAGVVYLGYGHHWGGAGTHVDAVDGLVNGGRLAAIKYLTGYALEKSLSVDNIVVIALLFDSLGVPPERRRRVLIWGVLGAVVMRGAMIFAGVRLIESFHWILYGFGGFLLATALKLLTVGGHQAGGDFAARVVRRVAPFLPPLVAAIVVIEVADLIFALDSIPAVFAVTADPFLVFTSNIFAVLGLRSLYFALASLMGRFRHLRAALAAILAVVGLKMLAADWLARWLGPRLNLALLALIVIILAVGALASRPSYGRVK